MNEVASPCCGSCEHYYYDKRMKKYECENIDVPAQNEIMPQGICAGNHYSPRNPILLIHVPGVKEMVEKTYRQGVKDRSFYREDKVNRLTKGFMKALEAVNE